MKNTGLWATNDQRTQFLHDAEEMMRTHLYHMEEEIHKANVEAQEERQKALSDTIEACETMNEYTAMEILFNKYSIREIFDLYEEFEKKREEEV